LFYDDSFVFVIILRAKAPSLVIYDEAGNFVIEIACSVTKFVSVTTESSLMNTFLVVLAPFSPLEGSQASLDFKSNPCEIKLPNYIREQPQLIFNCQSTCFTF
jgi:hypothetical protein